MRTLRARRSLILVVLVVAVLTAFAPALSSSTAAAVLAFAGLVIPIVATVIVRRIAAQSDERPVALLSIDFFRAPPSIA